MNLTAGAGGDALYATTIDDGLVGVISVTPQPDGSNLGYWLGEPFWGRGLMTEAVRAVVAEFFRQPDNQMLVSGVFRGNNASLAIQRNLGFEVTGESSVMCVARAAMVEHIDTRLTRQCYETASVIKS